MHVWRNTRLAEFAYLRASQDPAARGVLSISSPVTERSNMTPLDIDSGNTAWILTSSALVLLMTPGLALFYGGMVRVKSVLNMMMMSFVTIAVVTILWVVVGYSLTF